MVLWCVCLLLSGSHHVVRVVKSKIWTWWRQCVSCSRNLFILVRTQTLLNLYVDELCKFLIMSCSTFEYIFKIRALGRGEIYLCILWLQASKSRLKQWQAVTFECPHRKQVIAARRMSCHECGPNIISPMDMVCLYILTGFSLQNAEWNVILYLILISYYWWHMVLKQENLIVSVQPISTNSWDNFSSNSYVPVMILLPLPAYIPETHFNWKH